MACLCMETESAISVPLTSLWLIVDKEGIAAVRKVAFGMVVIDNLRCVAFNTKRKSGQRVFMLRSGCIC